MPRNLILLFLGIAAAFMGKRKKANTFQDLSEKQIEKTKKIKILFYPHKAGVL
jgi:hypothetical protein